MLPDLLKPNLKVVFCGTAAGKRSACIQMYYAGRGNKFWSVLFKVGFTPYQLHPQEFKKLLDFGIGLTDLVKTKSGMDSHLVIEDFDTCSFEKKILTYHPQIICFNGKRAAIEYLNRNVDYGLQPEKIANTMIFIAPSTSATAARNWDETYWFELYKLIIPSKIVDHFSPLSQKKR